MAPLKRGFAGLNSAFHDNDLMVRVAGDTLVLAGRPEALALAEEKLLHG